MLVLGATGFVGAHLRDVLHRAGVAVRGAARRPGTAELVADLDDPASLARALVDCEPAAVVNLAGFSSVGRSWQDPAGAFRANATGAAALLDAVRDHRPEAYLLLVSSGEVYGAPPPERLPSREDEPLAPQNPYAASKAAMELACGHPDRQRPVTVGVARPFGHLGPGQRADFAASSFARQVAMAEREGRDRVELAVGDLDVRRDLCDVRDVAAGYAMMVEHRLAGAHNLCSGAAVRIGELVELLDQASPVTIDIHTDPDRLRPTDAREMRGDPSRLRRACGWQASIPLAQTVADLLDHWRAQLAVKASL